jgi:hypothetical protein
MPAFGAGWRPQQKDRTCWTHALGGFLTPAAARGTSLFKMMDVSRYKSVDKLRGYVRDEDAFRDHAGAGLLWRHRVRYSRQTCRTATWSAGRL